MATDIEKLVVQLSADFKSFEKALARQQGVANKQFNAIERRARQMNKNLDGIFASSFKGMAAPLAGVGAALGTVELARLADTWSDLSSRVNLATGSQEKGTETMERLGDMARATYSSLEQTTEGFLANSGAIKDLGYNTDQALDYTESLNNALVVSGAKGDKAARVIDALANAILADANAAKGRSAKDDAIPVDLNKIAAESYEKEAMRKAALNKKEHTLELVLARLREEARKKGDKDWESVKLSPAQVSSINAVSEAYARQADELRKVQEAQSDAERAAAEFYDTFKSGMVGALTGANSLQDTLSGILKKLAEMILNSAFDTLFGGVNVSRSGGWLTGAMKAIGFADGGYTGSGGVNQPAGVVHKGEVVWSQKDVARAGGVTAVEAMRRGVRGYSGGGAVAMPPLKAPTMPILKAPAASGGSAVVNFAPVINAPNADRDGLARVEQQLAKLKADIPSQVIQSVRKAQKSNVRF